jgi:hypothetical protein
MIASDLGSAVEQCQSMIIVLSRKSVESGWVKEEYDAGLNQRESSKGEFHIIPIRIEECEIPPYLRATKWLDILDESLTLETASEILLSLYNVDTNLETGKNLDVFISRSWRDFPESELDLANAICETLSQHGFRLIGDSEEQKGFGKGNRSETIISSCGGLVAILPDRSMEKSALYNTSRYVVRELEFAQAMKMPYVVIMESSVNLSESLANDALMVHQVAKDKVHDQKYLSDIVLSTVWLLKERWKKPGKPHYIFYGTDFDEEHLERNQIVRRLIERVTAMPCIMGENIRQGQVQETIVSQISNAFMMIADISEDNLNTCIEAGIARGASVASHLIASAPRRRPPFMFRDQQVSHYEGDVDLLGIVHSIVQDYRRRIINYEL